MVRESGDTCPWDETEVSDETESETRMSDQCSTLIYIWQPGAFVTNFPPNTGIRLKVSLLNKLKV